ncbi:hypothetical protein Acr_24g0012310 [Actinidia rufa]|uniref:Uncharacterized protein n=1 Tax=Actinidia rufa TaxID=165716 RepID=A0A7J0GWD3_9ERIC|nr:hypothetical protein Acr_24g0012310 [Actinidia rufa]
MEYEEMAKKCPSGGTIAAKGRVLILEQGRRGYTDEVLESPMSIYSFMLSAAFDSLGAEIQSPSLGAEAIWFGMCQKY